MNRDEFLDCFESLINATLEIASLDTSKLSPAERKLQEQARVALVNYSLSALREKNIGERELKLVRKVRAAVCGWMIEEGSRLNHETNDRPDSGQKKGE